MSATRDSSQPITFVYTNLHGVYRRGVEAVRDVQLPEQKRESSALASQELPRVHPRFGAEAPKGYEKLFSKRSETYRVIRPSHLQKDQLEKSRVSLRSAKRILKVGEYQTRSFIQAYRPVHFLKSPQGPELLKKEHSLPASQPQIVLDLKLALNKKTSPVAETNQMKSALNTLDRLQARLHFLLREIQEFSGGGSTDGDIK